MRKSKLLLISLMMSAPYSFSQSIFENDTIYHPVLSDSGRLFSISVAADLNHVIVGANADSHDEVEQNFVNKSGAVLYYQKDNSGNYVFKQKVVPSNREVKGYFGYNIDISENSMIVGAEDDKTFGTTTIDQSGAVYLYNFESGSWVEKARFQDPDTSNLWGQEWGKHISIHGDYAVVGDRSNSYDVNGGSYLPGAGAVFVYKKDASGNWSFFQKLVASDRAQVAQCGLGVDIYGDYIAMGCENNETDSAGNFIGNSLGAVYIFELNSGTWQQSQKVLPHVTSDHGNFAGDIEVNDNYLVVTDRYNDYDQNEMNSMNQAGAVQIYKRINNRFQFQQKIVASDRYEYNLFGDAIALKGNDLAVYANKNIKDHTVRGKSYLFTESGGTWIEITGIEPAYRDSSASKFGTYNCLAFSGDDILHSYLSAHRINGKIRDAVYVYKGAITSVESVELNKVSFKLYPNPVEDQLSISSSDFLNEKVGFRVINIDGKDVLNGFISTMSNSANLDVSSLKRGVYIISLMTENGDAGSLKFIKQ